MRLRAKPRPRAKLPPLRLPRVCPHLWRQQFTHLAYWARSLLFTLLIHALILAFLLFNITWHRQSHITHASSQTPPVQAQLVFEPSAAQKAAEAAAKAAEAAAIAEKLARQKRAEQAAKKRRAEQARAREKAAREKREAQQRAAKKLAAEKAKAEAERKRQQAQAAAEKEKAAALLTLRQAELALRNVMDPIQAKIQQAWRKPLNKAPGLQATIQVSVALNGTVLAAKIVNSSGDTAFDASAESAVLRASPLPFPPNPKYYQHIKTFNILFKP